MVFATSPLAEQPWAPSIDLSQTHLVDVSHSHADLALVGAVPVGVLLEDFSLGLPGLHQLVAHPVLPLGDGETHQPK